MKEIIYNKVREKNIRDSDKGVVLKVITRLVQQILQTKKENRPTAVNALREIRRRIAENKPK